MPKAAAPSVSPLWWGAALVLGYWPALYWLSYRMIMGATELWSLLALGGAAWFLVRSPTRGSVRPLLALFGLVAYHLVRPHVPPLASGLLAALALGTSLCSLGTGRAFRPGILGLLVLGLPLAHSLNFFAGFPLRILATVTSCELLQLFGIAVTREGTALLWAGETVLVDVACSGIKMLHGGLVISFLLLSHMGAGWGRALWFGFLSLAGIIGVNIVRVTLLFFLETGLWNLPEMAHEGLGLLVYAAFILGLFSLSQRLLDKEALCTSAS